MKKIIIADTFLDSQDELSKKEKKNIRTVISKLHDENYRSSLSIHKLDKIICDKSFKSCRVNDDLRIILSQKEDQYVLLYVNHHDIAYHWAEKKFLELNSFGAMYTYDHFEISENSEKLSQFNKYQKGVLESKNIYEKDLIKLGISKVHSSYIIKIFIEDEFVDFISFLPVEIQEGLIDLYIGNKNIGEVYDNLNDNVAYSINQKDTKRRFRIIEDIDEFDKITKVYSQKDKWRVFLHPSQNNIIKRNYNGAALIEGGPGTGKTVVGMHRACYLKSKIYRNTSSKIYFITFNRNLRESIKNNLKSLYDLYEIPDNSIHVINVDLLFHDILNNNRYKIDYYEKKAERILMKDVYQSKNRDFSFDFFEKEYDLLISNNGINTLEKYLNISRKGMGKGISKNQRRIIWNFFDEFREKKIKRNIMNFNDRANLVYELYKSKQGFIDSIIIDETQDLSMIKIKALISLIKNDKNNIMFLSDLNQRIYQMKSWKSNIGINIVGRSEYLHLNYRTTRQIRKYADSEFFYTDSSKDYLRDYKSIFNGPEPYMKDFMNYQLLYDYMLECIKNWSNEIDKNTIGILLPKKNMTDIKDYLEKENVPYSYNTDASINKSNSVNICNIENCKGLEFKKTVLINYYDLIADIDYDNLDNWYEILKIMKYESQKYVAITRAKEEIILLNIEG